MSGAAEGPARGKAERRGMNTRTFLGAAAVVLFAMLAPATQASPGSLFGKNLMVNGDAEASAGAPSNTVIATPTGWTTTGEFTAVQYGASGGFPDKNSPGPHDRGKNFFAGGNVASSTASQTIDLSPDAKAIDGGGVTYGLSGWLGGYAGQQDNAKVTVTFSGANGNELGTATIGPVTAADRKKTSGFLRREAKGSVPAQTRSATVLVTSTRLEGTYNDGYSDNLVLRLDHS